jgi:hypothetical protein
MATVISILILNLLKDKKVKVSTYPLAKHEKYKLTDLRKTWISNRQNMPIRTWIIFHMAKTKAFLKSSTT